ncbi:hypothetical protein AKJ16_DCAP15364 [Drosera capensis]
MAVAVVGWSSVICEVSILPLKNGTNVVVVVGSAAGGQMVRVGAAEGPNYQPSLQYCRLINDFLSLHYYRLSLFFIDYDLLCSRPVGYCFLIGEWVCAALVCTTTVVCLAFCLVCTSKDFYGWAAGFFVSPEGAFPIFLTFICLDWFHRLPSVSESFIFCLRRILIILPNSGILALTDLAS